MRIGKREMVKCRTGEGGRERERERERGERERERGRERERERSGCLFSFVFSTLLLTETLQTMYTLLQ